MRGISSRHCAARRSQGAADGGGEIGFERTGRKTIRAVRNCPVASDDHHCRERIYGEKAVEAIGKYDRGERLVFFQIAGDQRFIFVAVGGKKKHIGICQEVRSDSGEQRFQRVARAAPRGPEIDDENFSLGVLERKRCTFRSLPEEKVGCCASVRIFLWPGQQGNLRDFIVGAEQIIAEAAVGTVGEAPDIAQLLADFAACRESGGESASANARVYWRMASLKSLFNSAISPRCSAAVALGRMASLAAKSL